MFTVYILYSSSTDSFYVGQTSDLTKRLLDHNQHIYTKAETRKANDWELFFSLQCESRQQALKIETHIKKMKSRKYFQNLARYPEISNKLLVKYAKVQSR